MQFINLVLRELKLRRYFDALVSGESLKKGKPNPAIFLATAKKIAVKPNQCLVIEDGLSGMIAAKRGRMKCIGLVKKKNKRKYPADFLVTNLKEILNF